MITKNITLTVQLFYNPQNPPLSTQSKGWSTCALWVYLCILLVYASVANPDPELLHRIRIQQKIKEQMNKKFDFSFKACEFRAVCTVGLYCSMK